MAGKVETFTFGGGHKHHIRDAVRPAFTRCGRAIPHVIYKVVRDLTDPAVCSWCAQTYLADVRDRPSDETTAAGASS